MRTLKQGQIQSQQRWQDQQDRLLVNCTSSGVARNIAQVPSATEGWIGHPLDPIGCLLVDNVNTRISVFGLLGPVGLGNT